MKLTGEATVRASIADVYAALIDPAILVRTIPGCQRLVQVDADSYRTTVLAGVASIKGTFAGQVRLSDRHEPTALTLHASGAGAPGTVSAIARVTLADADGATLVRYDADATIGGVIGGVGQRMLSGVARKTAAEFFAAIDRELSGGYPMTVPPSAQPTPGATVVGMVGPGGTGVTVTSGANATGTSGVANVSGAPAMAGGVWTAPAPAPDAARQRIRDVLTGAVFGAVVALLGVVVGALVAGWS